MDYLHIHLINASLVKACSPSSPWSAPAKLNRLQAEKDDPGAHYHTIGCRVESNTRQVLLGAYLRSTQSGSRASVSRTAP